MGIEYEVVTGEGVTPETKSGVLYLAHPKGSRFRFFCSTECGEKLIAEIEAA